MNKSENSPTAQDLQETGRMYAMRAFGELLTNFDVVATDEAFGAGELGKAVNFQIISRLQAPTAYDVSVRLAKAGWSYTDTTENRTAPCLSSPLGEQVRILREEHWVKLVYIPANVQYWTESIQCVLDAAGGQPAPANLVPVGLTRHGGTRG